MTESAPTEDEFALCRHNLANYLACSEPPFLPNSHISRTKHEKTKNNDSALKTKLKSSKKKEGHKIQIRNCEKHHHESEKESSFHGVLAQWGLDKWGAGRWGKGKVPQCRRQSACIFWTCIFSHAVWNGVLVEHSACICTSEKRLEGSIAASTNPKQIWNLSNTERQRMQHRNANQQDQRRTSIGEVAKSKCGDIARQGNQ